ncbi:hypothetical protein F4824DRAFT_502894 [Ustulina deusta]|nr:hypothetical protein F4824DRAFT_502894 [Ustulina deusta]
MAPRGSITPRTIMAPAAAFFTRATPSMKQGGMLNKIANESKAGERHLLRVSRIRTAGDNEMTPQHFDCVCYLRNSPLRPMSEEVGVHNYVLEYMVSISTGGGAVSDHDRMLTSCPSIHLDLPS